MEAAFSGLIWNILMHKCNNDTAAKIGHLGKNKDGCIENTLQKKQDQTSLQKGSTSQNILLFKLDDTWGLKRGRQWSIHAAQMKGR